MCKSFDGSLRWRTGAGWLLPTQQLVRKQLNPRGRPDGRVATVGCSAGRAPLLTGRMQNQSPPHAIDPAWTTTAFTIDRTRITHNLGVVRGITVRSRSIVGNVGASLQQLVGGNITIYTEMCE